MKLEWRIALGVFVGLAAFAALEWVWTSVQLAAFERQTEKLFESLPKSAVAPDPRVSRAVAVAPAQSMRKPIPPGWECISGTIVQRGRNADGTAYAEQLIIAGGPLCCSGGYVDLGSKACWIRP